MTIYLDIVLLENIILNYIILLSTAIISKSKIIMNRILISSTIGGVYAILNYVSEKSGFVNIILKIVISIIMVKVAFKEFEVKKILKQVIFFYLTSFTFGGIAFMLLYFVNPQNIIMNGTYFVGTYPLKITVLAGGVGFIIITIVTQYIKNKITEKTMIYDLEIFFDGRTKKIKSMLDTGNLLKEPITNADVIIVEKESLLGIISNDILENLNNIVKGKWISSNNINSYKFKLIPFSSLGNESGLLLGFKPDYIKIYKEEEFFRNDIIVGIYNGKLTKNNLYTSLIGLNILKWISKIKGGIYEIFTNV